MDLQRSRVSVALDETAREVSESEGIPLGTAKTRIRAAMLKLRVALEPGGLEPGEVSDS